MMDLWIVVILSMVLMVAVTAFSSQESGGVSACSIKTPVVVCPGFGNDIIDYVEPLKQPREVGLSAGLERRGFDPERIYIVPVQRLDWIRVAGGLFDAGFYSNTARPTGGGYGWYLERLKATVDLAYEESGGERVLLLGHSAGGWLARAAMGDGTWCQRSGRRTAELVRALVTIGAIHKPPADFDSCVTRGALAYTDNTYPGAYLAGEGVAYVSVGGDAIVGDERKREVDTNADRIYSARGEGSSERVAFTSYEAVCGAGQGVTGDGVVPLEWTQLEGARQIRLDGVLHSINEAGTTLPTDRWYGSEKVLDLWLQTALQEAGILEGKRNGFEGLSSLQKWAAERAATAQKAFLSL